ncbi:hypothetical protein VTH82DRAFT_248 [Thermothelomyces myriococcoides]
MVEDQLARFSLWTSSIGVFAPGRASMDHRLREAPDVHDAVITLLDSASDSVRDCLASLEAIMKAQKETGIKDMAPLYEDLRLAVKAVAGDITMLYQLSNTIRRASKELQNLRAAKAYCIRDDEGNNAEPQLRQVFDNYIRGKFPGISDSLRERLASSMVLRRKRILYRRSRYEKTALRAAKTVPQLKVQPVPAITQQQAVTVLGLLQSDSGENPAARNQTEQKQHQQGEQREEQHTAPSIVESSAPSATTLAADSYRKAATSSTISATKTIALSNHEDLDFPPAPLGRVWQRYKPRKKQIMSDFGQSGDVDHLSALSDESEATDPSPHQLSEQARKRLRDALKAEWIKCLKAVGEVICPYCLHALPCLSISDDRKWKAHVTGDLDAYVCLFDNCNAADELFTHSVDWLRHMREHTLRWRCNSKSHGLLVFETEDKYLSHMREVHPGSFTEPQLRVLAERNGRPVGPMFELCPFCGTSRADISIANMEDHIAGHLRSLALMSLPGYEDEAPDSSGSDKSSSSTDTTRSTIRNDPKRHIRQTSFQIADTEALKSRKWELHGLGGFGQLPNSLPNRGDVAELENDLLQELLRINRSPGAQPTKADDEVDRDSIIPNPPSSDTDEDDLPMSDAGYSDGEDSVSEVEVPKDAVALLNIRGLTYKWIPNKPILTPGLGFTSNNLLCLDEPESHDSKGYVFHELLAKLSHDEVMEMRHKSRWEDSSIEQPINVLALIRVRLTIRDQGYRTACYVKALGRWESEAYWVNAWLKRTSRGLKDPSLLVEALLGRPNSEVSTILLSFRKCGDDFGQDEVEDDEVEDDEVEDDEVEDDEVEDDEVEDDGVEDDEAEDEVMQHFTGRKRRRYF